MANLINLSATFVIEKIVSGFDKLNELLGLDYIFKVSDYNQALQDLINQNGAFYESNAVNIVFVRIEDFQHYDMSKGLALDEKKASAHVIELLDCLKGYFEKSTNKLILVSIKGTSISDSFLAVFEEKVKKLFNQYPHHSFIAHDRLTVLDKYAGYQAESDKTLHVPYLQPYYNGLAYFLVRFMYTSSMAPYKAIVLDCDNTLWKGVCGEDGPQKVEVLPGFEYLQKFCLDQMGSGKLLLLCSKNVESDVFDVFDQNAGMVLSRKDILTYRINWSPKSQNLYELSQELELNLDSFIYIDDNPVEIAEVKSACSNLLAITLPESETDFHKFLDSIWAFDVHTVTKEDAKRISMYKENVERKNFKMMCNNFSNFIDNLNIKNVISVIDKKDIPRVSQLIQRTNQFNNTALRKNENEVLKYLENKKNNIITVSVSDRFGDYGLVGALFYSLTEEFLTIELFLMSCRVLGRGVEYDILKYLAEIAKASKCSKIKIDFIPSKRNQPIENFLKYIANRLDVKGNNYIFSADLILNTTFSYEDYQKTEYKETAQMNISSDSKNEKIHGKNVVIENVLQKIPTLESFVDSLESEVSGYIVGKNDSVEKIICSIASVVLKTKVGPKDKFHDIKASSLNLVDIYNKICYEFKVDFPIAEFFNHADIASLSKFIEKMK